MSIRPASWHWASAYPALSIPPPASSFLSVILPWKNVALAEALRQRFVYPIAVFYAAMPPRGANVGTAPVSDVDNLLYVHVARALSAGWCCTGSPIWVAIMAPAGSGHMTVQPEGTLCRCGNRGCLATVATTDALLNRVRQLLRHDTSNALWTTMQHNFNNLTLTDVVNAAQDANPLAQQALAEIGRWLGVAVASAINLLNLEMVIVGGPLALAGDYLLAPLQNELARHAPYPPIGQFARNDFAFEGRCTCCGRGPPWFCTNFYPPISKRRSQPYCITGLLSFNKRWLTSHFPSRCQASASLGVCYENWYCRFGYVSPAELDPNPTAASPRSCRRVGRWLGSSARVCAKICHRALRFPQVCTTLAELADMADCAIIHGCDWDTHIGKRGLLSKQARPCYSTNRWPVISATCDRSAAGSKKARASWRLVFTLCRRDANLAGATSGRARDAAYCFLWLRRR